MPISILEPAIELSSFEVRIDWEDEQGNSTAPDTMSWTLHDVDNNVVNSRLDVSITTPVASELVFLEGLDLEIIGKDPVKRYVTFEGTYTSPNHGAGKPLRDMVDFTIVPLGYKTP
jgi:hypothetical protein